MLLREMLQHGPEPDSLSLLAALAVCEGQGEWRLALQLTTDQSALCRTAGPYNVAISACGAATAWLQSFDLLKMMKEARFSPDLLSKTAAAGACQKEGLWVAALGVLPPGPSSAEDDLLL